jgi:hypothetical protein
MPARAHRHRESQHADDQLGRFLREQLLQHDRAGLSRFVAERDAGGGKRGLQYCCIVGRLLAHEQHEIARSEIVGLHLGRDKRR